MRGIPVEEYGIDYDIAFMMVYYHQPFSEILKMTPEEILFFIKLAESENEFIQWNIERKKNKGKR